MTVPFWRVWQGHEAECSKTEDGDQGQADVAPNMASIWVTTSTQNIYSIVDRGAFPDLAKLKLVGPTTTTMRVLTNPRIVTKGSALVHAAGH